MDDLVSAVDLLRPLVADGTEGDAEPRLVRHGWRVADGDRRTWSSGEFAGQLFPGLGRGGADLFEVTLLAKPGDVDDAEYEERRHEEFSALFEAGVERLRPWLGAP